MADNHTPLSPSIDDSIPPQQTPVASLPVNPPAQQVPLTVGATKEAGPTILKQEAGQEVGQEEEASAEKGAETERKREVKKRQDIPDIHPEAAKAGLQVAPSVSPFPSLYDVKIPVLKDEEVEKNLHSDFWTGARWLAELCKYILLQAHIRLKKVGNKIVRERVIEKF